MGYLRKMRSNQQSEPPHIFVHMNPFSRNPGSAPEQVLLHSVKTQMKCSMMLDFIRDYTVCKGQKNLPDKKYNIFLNYILTPLDVYNGLS